MSLYGRLDGLPVALRRGALELLLRAASRSLAQTLCNVQTFREIQLSFHEYALLVGIKWMYFRFLSIYSEVLFVFNLDRRSFRSQFLGCAKRLMLYRFPYSPITIRTFFSPPSPRLNSQRSFAITYPGRIL